MDGYAIYVHRHAKNNDFLTDFVIFTKALRTNQPTDQPTNGPTDGPIDIPSYRDAIAASKNQQVKSGKLFLSFITSKVFELVAQALGL